MRSALHLKFFIVYIAFGFLILFSVSAIAPQMLSYRLEKTTAERLYTDASTLSSEYLPQYFSEDISFPDVHMQLEGMQKYTTANLWFVEADGTLITSSTLSGQPLAPDKIDNFNPAENGSDTYQIGNYHNYFDENMITTITPVTNSYVVKGYLLIHKPVSHLEEECKTLLLPVYITAFVIYLLSFSILAAFQFFVYRPLRKITEAAKQYASGNLEYEIPVNTQDEIVYLSATLNYMSTQLKDMDDYQKKFVANVSHDFRSPLTSIKGYLEAMADGTIPVEMQDKYFKIILFETERLTDLTQDLLTLNQFDTKNLLLEKTSFDIHEVIKNTAATFEGTCTAKHISIKLLFAAKTLYVSADKRKIQQVLYNLLDLSLIHI